MKNKYRTHNCGELNKQNIGEMVRLAGWVQRVRNLGKMQFIDLRDEAGITQLVINAEETLQKAMKDVTTECTISAYGKVVERASKNPKISTGEIEIEVKELEVLGKCKNVLPFEVNSDKNEAREDLRLEYRFLDLRNEKLHQNIVLRSEILHTIREEMRNLHFTEVQTPILANSSPEGARDFLVPSRLHPGEFYALPQAPQQFKQLLMVSGFNRYYQIAPCFRDEDPRADRSPGEFYQMDFEMAFAEQEDVFEVMENVIPHIFEKHASWKTSPAPFTRIPYREAMEKYGTDKPDLRNPLVIVDVTETMHKMEFRGFAGKTVKAICVKNGAQNSRKFFDHMVEYAVEELGAGGLAWIKCDETSKLSGSIAKFVTEVVQEQLTKQLDMQPNDAVFFLADDTKKVIKMAGELRMELGRRLDLLEKDIYRFCWIVDFPMYELSDEGEIDFCHNPFSMPQGGMKALEEKNPLDVYAYQYDLVCNGYELASGAVRNHDPELMVKVFEIAGYQREDVENRFGALFHAFQYGAPPHAGAAPGIDRMIMLIEHEDNIRNVIAFPKNKKARDLLMRAPSRVDEKQLKDVHIKIDLETK